MQQEISRPLREELSEIKEILKSIQKSIDSIDRRQAMEDKVYDQWLDQYDTDISEPPKYLEEEWNRAASCNIEQYDPEPYVPTHAASREMVEEAMRKHSEWEERHGLR